MTAKVELPTAIDALEGINAALKTADMHLVSARVLDGAGIHGPAVSHLILALEEAAKALILIRVWWAQARGIELDMPAEEVHELIRRSHRLRHIFAGLQALSDQTLNALLARQNRDEPLPATGVVADDSGTARLARWSQQAEGTGVPRRPHRSGMAYPNASLWF
jgi:hypothetical protein